MNSPVNSYSEKKMREVFENTFKTHFQYAPRSAKVIWSRFVEAVFALTHLKLKSFEMRSGNV